MSGPEYTDRENLYMNDDGPAGFTGFSDSQSGEYRYKSGYTQRIYSDAHYVPAGESTVPPRYYTPPEEAAKNDSGREQRQRPAESSRRAQRAEREKEQSADKQRRGRGLSVLLACLICFVIGAAAGAVIVQNHAEARLESMEQRIAEAESDIKEANSLGRVAVKATSDLAERVPTPNEELSPAEIYSMACEQVVDINADALYEKDNGISVESSATGSGFIISEDGYILTNYHVIKDVYKHEARLTVTLHDGREFTARIAGTEEAEDVAMLKIDASELKPVTFGDSDKLTVGDEVYAIGNPLGNLNFSMAFGRVSALNRTVASEGSIFRIKMFQIDAALNSGNSGGPVYNNRGEVVGIATAKYADAEGLAFAIPINEAMDYIGSLMNGTARLAVDNTVTEKAYLGVAADKRFSAVYSRYYGIPMGAYVSAVFKGTSAERAGIQPGDIITAVGDVTVKSSTELFEVIDSLLPGYSTTVTVYRSGNEIKLDVILGKEE